MDRARPRGQCVDGAHICCLLVISLAAAGRLRSICRLPECLKSVAEYTLMVDRMQHDCSVAVCSIKALSPGNRSTICAIAAYLATTRCEESLAARVAAPVPEVQLQLQSMQQRERRRACVHANPAWQSESRRCCLRDGAPLAAPRCTTPNCLARGTASNLLPVPAFEFFEDCKHSKPCSLTLDLPRRDEAGLECDPTYRWTTLGQVNASKGHK